MKLQNKYPYDVSIVGLNGIFHSVGFDSFFINSECILATNQIITTGKTYVIVDTPTAKGVKMYDVKLVDVYFNAGVINMIVREMLSQKNFNMKLNIDCTKNDCKWMLVDLDYFIDKMNANAIKQYCWNCDNTNKKPAAENDSKSDRYDLLDFDYS